MTFPSVTSSYRTSPGKIGSPAASAEVQPAGRSLFEFKSKTAPEPAFHDGRKRRSEHPLGVPIVEEARRRGIALVPQGREIFSLLTVKENLETGFAPLNRADKKVPDEVFELFPVLQSMLKRRGGVLAAPFQADSASGAWKTHRYEVSSQAEALAANPNWFPVEAFVAQVESAE